MGMKNPTLSVCMIVKNEEKNLENCLGSIDGLADEMVIVDTGSTDSTVEIASRLGAKVFSHEWRRDFSEARNFSLGMATGDWVLVIDADEEVPSLTKGKIRGVIGESGADGIEVTVRSELPESDSARYDDSKIVRLFRNRKEFRYVMPIHEQIRPSIEKAGGKVAESDMVIVHHGYSSMVVQGSEKRADRNLVMLRESSARFPDEPYFHYQLGATLMSGGGRGEALEEFRKALSLDYGRLGGAVLDKLFMKVSQLALERNDFAYAIQNAESSLRLNRENTISMYVAAVGYLSMGRIAEGYEYLLMIRSARSDSLRIGRQLEELIEACEKVLKA